MPGRNVGATGTKEQAIKRDTDSIKWSGITINKKGEQHEDNK